jgi:hypothetical protein
LRDVALPVAVRRQLVGGLAHLADGAMAPLGPRHAPLLTSTASGRTTGGAVAIGLGIGNLD